MLNKLMTKDDITEDENNYSKLIIDIKSLNLSERVIPTIQTSISRKIRSENRIESNTNYNDLCGPWIYPKNPVYARYINPPISKLCVWKYFTMEDIIFLKKHRNEEQIIIFEQIFLNKYKGKNSNILVKLLWEFFKFVRFHSFTEKGVSVVLGVIYLTYLFFSSNPWWSAEEVLQFFHESILVHTVLNPPNSIEILSMAECKLLFKIFHEIFLENLVLLHILCHEIYHFTINLNN